jgi:hypothetical protein
MKRSFIMMKQDNNLDYELLLACYLSGQISESQWVKHLCDLDFAEWYRIHKHDLEEWPKPEDLRGTLGV